MTVAIMCQEIAAYYWPPVEVSGSDPSLLQRSDKIVAAAIQTGSPLFYIVIAYLQTAEASVETQLLTIRHDNYAPDIQIYWQCWRDLL